MSADPQHDTRVRAVLLDVNETLFAITPVGDRFVDAGLDRGLVDVWFARVLRDGFALAVTGQPASFPDLGRHHLRVLLETAGLAADDTVTSSIMAGFGEVEAHPDVAEGLTAAADAGLRVATLTNGTHQVTADFLARADLSAHVEATLEAADAGAWKPHRRAYHWAADQLGLAPSQVALVAVHPWDVHGASAAGMHGAWLARDGAPWPPLFAPPTWTASTLGGLVRSIIHHGTEPTGEPR